MPDSEFKVGKSHRINNCIKILKSNINVRLDNDFVAILRFWFSVVNRCVFDFFGETYNWARYCSVFKNVKK